MASRPSRPAPSPDRPGVLLLSGLLCGLLVCGFVLAPLPGATPALAWQAVLPDTPQTPPLYLAVEKSSQRFLVLSRQSPVQVLRELPCATGQAEGAKQLEGDLKTPEGVYFLEHKLTTIDRELYGSLAYTLDYPNPVDRIQGRTGRGIWIHGRGRAIEPRETKGCVALNTPDLQALDTRLVAGTPVLIAEALVGPGPDGAAAAPAQAATADLLTRRVQAWAQAWQGKSKAFFAFYDPELFARSEGGSFAAFRRQKESLFDRYPWIQVHVSEIHALPGPDYWVTSFDQYYRTPSYTSCVTKRLYWLQDEAGSWRIVGRVTEEAPRDRETLEARYLTAMQPQVDGLLRTWRQAWQHADADGYGACYLPDADQDGRSGKGAIVEHKRAVWQKATPTLVQIQKPSLALHPDGIEARFVQEYADSSGYSDLGLKTLVLSPTDSGWAIASESWQEIAQ